jgi:methionyl-tRNA formyltransferase
MRVLYIGTAEIGVPALQALVDSDRYFVTAVVTQPDRPVGRHQKLTPSPVKEAALKSHLKIYQPENINTAAVLAQLRFERPDVIIVCAYGQILRKPLLELPEYGCLNIHASLLPKYRGAACIQGAILNGEKETGVTIMRMDEGLDTGDILAQDSLSIRKTDTAGTIHDRLAQLAPSLLLKTLDGLVKGKVKPVRQDDRKATYMKRLTKESGHIDWKKPQTEIDCHIRAMTPWPSAYTWLPEKGDQKMLKIFTTILSNRAKGKPGEVLRVDKHGILVAAGKGGLLLREVQLEGKRRMHAAEFARGYNLPVGTILE